MPEPPALDNLPRPRAPGQVGEPLEGYTFEGYPQSGRQRRHPPNILAVTTTVQCVVGCWTIAWSGYARNPAALPQFDDVVPLSHSYGCGVAINAPDAVIPIRTLHNISRNPNFGRPGAGHRPGLREAAGQPADAGR